MVVVVMMVVAMIMRMVAVSTDTLYMMVVTFLWLTHFVLHAYDLHTVLTQLAVHVGVATADLLQALHKSVDDFFVGIQVRCFDDGDVWVCCSKHIRCIINTFY